MKNILIITSYFPPEIGAASNRISNLAIGLQKQGFQVSVVTPLPNYPTGNIFNAYKGRFSQTNVENKLTIHRLWIYASNSKNLLLRFVAMASYSFSLIWFCLWNKIPQTVIVQSPPLLVAFTSMLILRSKNRKLILNVSDLWPNAGLELGVFKRGLGYSILESIERFNYKKSDLIMGQSEEIITHIKSLCVEKHTFLYRNYSTFDQIGTEVSSGLDEKIKIVYAGLLGVAQGICKLCQELDYSKIEFHIYGSGAEQGQIENFISRHPDLPITYCGNLNQEDLHYELLTYDVAIVPLLKRIYGSVPSKIFEFARLGLPMIYFGGGEAEAIVVQNQLGWVANPGDYKHLNHVISKLDKADFNLESRQRIRATATKQFDFEKQLKALNNEISRLCLPL